MSKRTAVVILLLLCAALNFSIEVEAQVAGTISGYVRDESGAVIPGADVKATMVGQQLTRSVVSDETGFFNFLAQVVSSTASFGRITGAEDGRVGQVVVKLLW